MEMLEAHLFIKGLMEDTLFTGFQAGWNHSVEQKGCMLIMLEFQSLKIGSKELFLSTELTQNLSCKSVYGEELRQNEYKSGIVR